VANSDTMAEVSKRRLAASALWSTLSLEQFRARFGRMLAMAMYRAINALPLWQFWRGSVILSASKIVQELLAKRQRLCCRIAGY
jgi:hypothetical protein